MKTPRAIFSVDIVVDDLGRLADELADAGEGYRVARVKDNKNGTFTANIDLLLTQEDAEGLIGDSFTHQGKATVNSARGYKFNGKTFASKGVTFRNKCIQAVNPNGSVVG